MTAWRFLVTGRVQGVGYRWFVARAARRIGVDGHARNLPDGNVEVVAVGSDTALERLAAMLAEGPPGARVAAVNRVEIADEPPVPKGFATL